LIEIHLDGTTLLDKMSMTSPLDRRLLSIFQAIIHSPEEHDFIGIGAVRKHSFCLVLSTADLLPHGFSHSEDLYQDKEV